MSDVEQLHSRTDTCPAHLNPRQFDGSDTTHKLDTPRVDTRTQPRTTNDTPGNRILDAKADYQVTNKPGFGRQDMDDTDAGIPDFHHVADMRRSTQNRGSSGVKAVDDKVSKKLSEVDLIARRIFRMNDVPRVHKQQASMQTDSCDVTKIAQMTDAMERDISGYQAIRTESCDLYINMDDGTLDAKGLKRRLSNRLKVTVDNGNSQQQFHELSVEGLIPLHSDYSSMNSQGESEQRNTPKLQADDPTTYHAAYCHRKIVENNSFNRNLPTETSDPPQFDHHAMHNQAEYINETTAGWSTNQDVSKGQATYIPATCDQTGPVQSLGKDAPMESSAISMTAQGNGYDGKYLNQLIIEADDSVQKETARCYIHPRPCCYPWRLKKTRRAMQLLAIAALYAVVVLVTRKPRDYEDKVTAGVSSAETVLISGEAGVRATEEMNFDLAEDPGTVAKDRQKRQAEAPINSTTTIIATTVATDDSTTSNETHVCVRHNPFPSDFTPVSAGPELRSLINLFIGIYMFAAVAAVCDIYFVPSLEHICEDLDLPADVAGATFMAAASSAPEFCTSVIGVFLSENDVGLSAIVGSSIFNLLGIIGACSLFAGMPVALSWYPLTRDTLFYLISVLEMVAFMYDSRIVLGEAVVMVLTYCLYIFVMLINQRLERWAMAKVKALQKRTSKGDGTRRNSRLQMMDARRKSRISRGHLSNSASHSTVVGLTKSGVKEVQKLGFTEEEVDMRLQSIHGDDGSHSTHPKEKKTSSDPPGNKHTNSLVHHNAESAAVDHQSDQGTTIDEKKTPVIITEKSESATVLSRESHLETEEGKDEKVEVSAYENPLEFPKTMCGRIYWVIILPVTVLHAFTIPDSRMLGTWRARCYLMSFIISVAYIAIYSYVMVWMITAAGDHWNVPETVTGLTLLAAGTSVPDCLSSVFVARDGYGDMAVSNAIGSNVFDILLCLGVPWTIDAIINSDHGTDIDSKGMLYAVFTLMVTIIYLWCSMRCFNWTLTRFYGCVTLMVYVVIITFCILLEMNVFFKLHDFVC